MEKKIFCNLYTKKVHEIIFLLKVSKNSSPNYASFPSLVFLYFRLNVFCLNVFTNIFYTILLHVKT